MTQGVGVASPFLADIMYTRSNDLGVTWSLLTTVNSDSINDQFQPRLAVDAAGAIGIIWYDRRHDLNNLRIHVREGISYDNGLTFTDLLVTDTDFGIPPINPNFNVGTANCYMGDYNAIIAHQSRFLMAWGDNRLSTNEPIGIYPGAPIHLDPDIRFDSHSSTDLDGDGWPAILPIPGFSSELYMGTDPFNACTPGGWPPDPLPLVAGNPDGNGAVQIDDVTFVASAFGSTTTPRAEIASQNAIVQIDDVTAFASRFGQTC